MELAYNLGGLVHYHHGSEHCSTQADVVLEKQLRVLYPDPQTTGTETLGLARTSETSKPAPSDRLLPPTKSHLLILSSSATATPW